MKTVCRGTWLAGIAVLVLLGYSGAAGRDAGAGMFTWHVCATKHAISAGLIVVMPAEGGELAYVEDRNTAKILNLATKQVRTLLTINEIFASAENRVDSPY